MTFESVEYDDEDEAEQPIKPARCRCYMPTTATPPSVITAADQVRRNLRLSGRWARFGRLMVEQLLAEHDGAVERAEKAEAARDTAVTAWSAQQDIIEAERRRAEAAARELAELRERIVAQVADHLRRRAHDAALADVDGYSCEAAATWMAAAELVEGGKWKAADDAS